MNVHVLAVASRVTRALELTLSQPSFLETLVKEYGVCIEEVCMMLSWQVYAGVCSVELQGRVHMAGANVTRHADCICAVECPSRL